MQTDTVTKSITLYYREGSSDKVYQAAIEPSGSGYLVNFAFGRRGTTLQTGTKTLQPVVLEEAKKIFGKLVQEKTAKGYTPGEDGTPYQQTDKAERATGIVPQLCNPIDEAEAEKLLESADWWAQEKFDGRRVLIRRVDDNVIGINRLGLVIALPREIADHARKIGSQQWLIDGEAVGDMFFAFDLLESAGTDLRKEPYRTRLTALSRVVTEAGPGPIRSVATANTAAAKRAMFNQLKAENREGLVFKRHLAPHSPGRPASGADWLKLKFTTTCSCIVTRAKGNKRSVTLELLDGDKRIAVGSVTIPANHAIPTAGQIVEVRYLYAYPGGSLYQPVYLGDRDDVVVCDCRLSQLKLKARDAEGDDA